MDYPLEAILKPVAVVIGLIIFIRLFARRAPRTSQTTEIQRAPLPPDQQLGSYFIDALVADGGTASVYTGYDNRNTRVAIKIPHRPQLADREFVETFAREAEIGVDLRHPAIVRVLEAGSYASGGIKKIPYLVMEFLQGEDLRTKLDREKLLDQKAAAQIARSVADALAWAHSHGVVHRDVSPRNVYITNRRAVKVMDFGISTVFSRFDRKRLNRALTLGTPEYLAPERTNDPRSADARSDLYALGCVFYEMLTGQPPYPADSPREILMKHRSAPIPTLHNSIDPTIRTVVQRLLQKKPDDRYQSGGQVAADLADLVPIV
ncbi:MAG: serine/threonine protein kinase [Armatimonadetes bacterium]|nr:serine/threonine protein kinase [Armatimonadota bacterium]